MSGICGMVFKNGTHRLNTDSLKVMCSALDSGQVDWSQEGECLLDLGCIGIGVKGRRGRTSGVVEIMTDAGPVALAFHGSLYGVGVSRVRGVEEYTCLQELLHLYVRRGISFLEELRGEFALAIWDRRIEKLYLATDRFRICPLAYYQDGDNLIFASRIRGILASPITVKRSINPEAIADVVASSVVLTPKTIFREIKKLPPGHVLTYQRGSVKLEPYWDISFLNPKYRSKGELIRETRHLMREALEIRLATEGHIDQIGTFLSGGIDSSTVTGIMTQLARRPIKSFSIGFDEPRFNEMNYARIAARAFGSEHYDYFVTPHDVCEAIPVLMKAYDEPFANASAVPTYFCAKLAREHGTHVLYAGDGGDELFAGNERYATQRLFEYYHKIPKWVRRPFVEPLISAMADGLGWEICVKGNKYIQRASIPYPERLSTYGFFKVVPMREFLEDDLLETVGRDYDPYATVNWHYSQAPARSELDKQLYIDLKLAISDNDLFKVDRMSEAAGVTVRFPFLDHRLAEFAATIPANVKMQSRHLRSFFKKAYADLLPVEIRSKTKHGFGLPLPIWLRTDKCLNEMMHDLVLSPRSVQRGYFRRKAMEELIERHKTDETSFYGTVLWNLMILELWHRHEFDYN